MRLAFLASADSVHSAKWVNFFAQEGFQILWISLGPKTQKVSDNIEFVDLSTYNIPKQIFLSRRILKKWKPDILHTHSVGTYGFISLFCRPADTKYVVTPWGSDVIFGSKNIFKRPWIKSVLKNADLVTADANFMIELVQKLGARPTRCQIINFGIDTKRFYKRPVDPEILNRLNIPDDGLRIISSRNFEPVYDVETVIRASAEVLKCEPSARFLLLGRGSLLENLKTLAIQLGVDKRVHFLGHFPNQDLPALLCSNHIYISTSLSDAGIAASTAEAMACELPVIITDAAENSKWITNDKNGLLVPAKDPQALAKAILRMLKNYESFTKLGTLARSTIIERNDYSGEMKKMANLYSILMRKNSNVINPLREHSK